MVGAEGFMFMYLHLASCAISLAVVYAISNLSLKVFCAVF